MRGDPSKTEVTVEDTMLSGSSFLYTLVLFSELSSHLFAMPATTAEDSAREWDDLGLIVGDEPMTELDEILPLYRRNHLLDDRNEEGRSTIMVVPVSVSSDFGCEKART